MARINVYLPDALASEVRSNSLNMSALTQLAAREALTASGTTQTKGKMTEYATPEKVDYLAARFQDIQRIFAERPGISEIKSRRILASLQDIAAALESDRFDEL